MTVKKQPGSKIQPIQEPDEQIQDGGGGSGGINKNNPEGTDTINLDGISGDSEDKLSDDVRPHEMQRLKNART